MDGRVVLVKDDLAKTRVCPSIVLMQLESSLLLLVDARHVVESRDHGEGRLMSEITGEDTISL